jgi:hypothetical protein
VLVEAGAGQPSGIFDFRFSIDEPPEGGVQIKNQKLKI